MGALWSGSPPSWIEGVVVVVVVVVAAVVVAALLCISLAWELCRNLSHYPITSIEQASSLFSCST